MEQKEYHEVTSLITETNGCVKLSHLMILPVSVLMHILSEGSINGGYNCRHQDQQELLMNVKNKRNAAVVTAFPVRLELRQSRRI